MTETDLKILRGDNDGLLTYEYLANHIGECGPEEINALIENMVRIDLSGQFMASAARYLHAIDPAGYAPAIRELVAGAIDKRPRAPLSPRLASWPLRRKLSGTCRGVVRRRRQLPPYLQASLPHFRSLMKILRTLIPGIASAILFMACGNASDANASILQQQTQ